MTELTSEIILNVEKTLVKEASTELVLLINTIDGGSSAKVEALFTNRESARKYMIRIAINSCIELYTEYLNDIDTENNQENGFYKFVKEYIDDYFELLSINHIDINKPVYKVQTGNYKCYGSVKNYLVNSAEEWKAECIKQKQYRDHDKWMKCCLVEVDPIVPEIQIDNI